MTDWGIQIGPNPKKVIGRKLPCESLLFGNNSTFPANEKGDFTMALRSKSNFFKQELEVEFEFNSSKHQRSSKTTI